MLARDPAAQALVMVPEINLTPQLQARFVERFGAEAVVALHSGMTNPQRLRSWLARTGARASCWARAWRCSRRCRTGLIVVDEEHDPSYKQQEGARYSARDLACGAAGWRARRCCSARPRRRSKAGRPATAGRYQRLEMPNAHRRRRSCRAVRLVDMNHQPKKTVISRRCWRRSAQRIARGEQSLVFLNRRGYAPVLACGACDWKSECPHCSAYRVFHKIDRTLRCHHCGFTERVPRACPACGNPDIAPLGRGTERLEEHLAELLHAVNAPPRRQPVRIARIDADSTRGKGALESQLAQVHAGEVDVLVGTQMVTKGARLPPHHAGGRAYLAAQPRDVDPDAPCAVLAATSAAASSACSAC
jgi:primosomal protein N' (replication factor Y)